MNRRTFLWMLPAVPAAAVKDAISRPVEIREWKPGDPRLDGEDWNTMVRAIKAMQS